jgi:NAD+ synthase (glutamine-hydrolysing)
MAHYHVNASVPKTLVRHLIQWAADSGSWNAEFTGALHDVIETAISPELVPAADGAAAGDQPVQLTEDTLGAYALHDFFLYGLLRHGYTPAKLAFLAAQSWARTDADAPGGSSSQPAGHFSFAEIRRTLEIFLTRFFQGSQFKRSCIANGPKVGSGGSLSPRGDWRAPSDSDAGIWLAALESVPRD